MKATYVYQARNTSIPLPNAATRRQMLHKALNSLLMAASGAGIGAMILLLLALA